MKLAIRIFALSLVVAGAAAASVSSSTTRVVPGHQSATGSLPTPACGPRMPTCPPNGN
jgi:P pilus assembly chaperone PapD